MKTMKKQREIKRVPETQVDFFLQAGWEFCSKTEWKETVRDKGVDNE
jgi:hypothetical protein